MPGLLRGIARTAAIAGTATTVSNRVSRRQANKWAAQDQQQQPQYQEPPQQYQQAPPPARADDDRFQKLKELGELKEQGILTDAEFAAEKAKILQG